MPNDHYEYPSVPGDQQRAFLEDLLDMLDRSQGLLPDFHHIMLKGILEAGRSLVPLDFSTGAAPNILVENFSAFYLNRLAVFKHSTHVLDVEPDIQARLLKSPLTADGIPVTHYRFADSRSKIGIQLSDVIVGLLGKMYTYFTRTTKDEVMDARNALCGPALENALLLRNLVSISDAANAAFLHHVASSRDVEKLDLFLRFDDGG